MTRPENSGATVYDLIGRDYARTRKPDTRIAAVVAEALGDCASVVNVGAGTGSYEPTDRPVLAVEPSEVMIRQRPPTAAPAICARAEALPLDSNSFDAVMAILTIHHWEDRARGIAELRRVARRRVVLLTWDPSFVRSFWLTDYLPSMAEIEPTRFPSIDDDARALGDARVVSVAVPHDCTDGFLGANWRRPAAYLDEEVRSNISGIALLAASEVRRA